MDRRHFLSLAASAGALSQVPLAYARTLDETGEVFPGVWKFSFGTPERFTPVATRRYAPAAAGLAALPKVDAPPVTATGEATDRGYLVRLPLAPNEMVYGLGLQLHSFMQRGLKKKLRVNADPEIDSGDSHAPVPFYVTTHGYGVLVDTARYATFYCGNKELKTDGLEEASDAVAEDLTQDQLPSAYRRFRFNKPSEVIVEVPEGEGVDVYVFAGPSMREAVQRYNLFAGGGALPPRWGLGNWYRCHGQFTQDDVAALTAEFRERGIPMDVIGLEPGWQTHAYSCSYVWSDRFPDPAGMIERLGRDHFRLNLWEHAFTHPTSPLYEPLYPLSGNYEVWDGLVPDFLLPEARAIFAGFHAREHVALGVSGYKLDECDNSDFTRNWSFPEFARFPSGADGEQMHGLFGLRYQDTIQSVFDERGQRTYGLVRSSQALAAPYPYVLYSDLYDHPAFIKAVAKVGLSGLLWTPEVRHAESPEDLVRRLQAAVLSPMALINAWYIRNPPWKQVEQHANNEGQFAPGWEQVEALCRDVLALRMRLVPHLHAAFVHYHRTGLPPFRPLVMDDPEDVLTWPVDDQYLIGEGLLAAPVTAGVTERSVYLPAGDWYDFWSGQRHTGGQRVTVPVPLEQVPLFVKSGTLLPLADATLHTDDPASGRLTVRAYGAGPAAATLYEEDGTGDPALTPVRLSWDGAAGSLAREGPARTPGYEVVAWERVA